MIRSKYIHGTTAAINVEFGYIPDFVIITNYTDSSSIILAVLDKVVVFDSGGTNQVKPGHKLKGATSGATMIVREVILDSGSWSSGNAAGWFICDHEDISGTIVAENMDQDDTNTQTNVVTVVVDVEYGVEITNAALGAVTGNNGCLGYTGDASNGYAKGITLGSGVSTDGKLLHIVAFKNDPGEGQGPLVLGNDQQTVW